LYSCVYFPYGSYEQVRYVFATPDPPLADDGLPAVKLYYQPPSGFSNCSLQTWGLATQPPGTTTAHPV
jgi:hypothetical protein